MKEEQQKLLYKALCMYLSYEVGIIHCGDSYILNGLTAKKLILKRSSRTTTVDVDDLSFTDIALLPLSALTEREIKIDKDDRYCIERIKSLDTHWYGNLKYSTIEYLLSNHYDIFNFIPKGLAIDKRTVK